MNNLILALPGAEDLAQDLAERLGCEANAVEVRYFADGEQLVRLRTSVDARRVLLAAQLFHPADKTLTAIFTADAARELGAAEVGLVAPYLPYMRQDARFRAGEAVSSRSYARLLSGAFNFLVCVGPHLHRIRDLREIYRIPTRVVSPAAAIAGWLAHAAPHCILVGDRNATWIGEIAAAARVPFVLLEAPQDGRPPAVPAASSAAGRTPVLMEDIASTCDGLIAAAQALRAAGWGTPIAVVIHALLRQEDVQALHHAGVARIAACTRATHSTGVIPLDDALADAVRALCA